MNQEQKELIKNAVENMTEPGGIIYIDKRETK